MTLTSAARRILIPFHFFWRGLFFLWKLKGIVFFGGYPYPERQSDGYFQRTKMVDRLFTDRWRIYVEGEYHDARNHWFDCPEENVLVLRITGKPFQRLMAQACALLCVLKCGRIYFHSILTMLHRRTGWLLYIPSLTKVIDIHGAVPEEFRLRNDFYSAMLYEPVEQLAIRNCNVIVVVTKAMENYLRQKYREKLRGQILLLPMYPNYPMVTASRPYLNGRPVIVYAGGLQNWQQVSKMVEAISLTHSLYKYRFYCRVPFKIRELLPERDFPDVVIDHKEQNELLGLYQECHYGFILREDTIVNNVACPTKLVEYLAMGIVPIVNTEKIGDFYEMGMQSIKLDALLRNSLPEEVQRLEMARLNFELYERLGEIHKEGSSQIQALLSDRSKQRGQFTRSLQ